MYILATKIFERKELLSKKAPSTFSIIKENHYDIVKKIIHGNGKVLIEEPTGVITRFENPVLAVLSAIKIQKYHKNSKKNLTPQISIVIFKEKELIVDEKISLDIIEKIRILCEDSGFGEIVVSNDISKMWKKQGNRKLSTIKRTKVFNGEEISLSMIEWDTSTHEPLPIKRRRGNILVFLMLLPSIIIGFIIFFLKNDNINDKKFPVFIAGPVYSMFSKLKCDTIYKNLDNSKNFLNFCKIKNINLLEFPKGSKEITGRVRKNKQNYELILDLVLIPDGILYNRISVSMSNYKDKPLNNAIKKASDLLISSYLNPTLMEQFKDLFQICNENKIPEFLFRKNNKIKFLRRLKGNRTCVEEIIKNLPAVITGKQN